MKHVVEEVPDWTGGVFKVARVEEGGMGARWPERESSGYVFCSWPLMGALAALLNPKRLRLTLSPDFNHRGARGSTPLKAARPILVYTTL